MPRHTAQKVELTKLLRVACCEKALALEQTTRKSDYNLALSSKKAVGLMKQQQSLNHFEKKC